MSYLKRSNVYAFYIGRRMVGGFILGQKLPLRTIDIFVASENRQVIDPMFSSEDFCEVCCFWVQRRYRYHPILSGWFWLKMAYAVKRQNRPIIVYGTNSAGLARVYGYPKNSLAYHTDTVNDRTTNIFLAQRKDFVGGVWEIVWAKLRGQNMQITQAQDQPTPLQPTQSLYLGSGHLDISQA